MEVQGKIKVIGQTATFGEKGFRKREVVVTTFEQYPQDISIEFVQDKCDILDKYKVGQSVKVGINLRGREWKDKQGVVRYFNSIQGWKIDVGEESAPATFETISADDLQHDSSDLPF